jgi:hypothetical protein
MIDALKPATDTHLPLISIDDHAHVDLSGYNAPEDWLALGLFWLMCTVVFLQFFTRYVLNDSFAWTEEIARYVLIAVIYVGTAMCVRRCGAGALHLRGCVAYRVFYLCDMDDMETDGHCRLG